MVGTALARRQRAQTKQESERELKRRARGKLKTLREQVRDAKAQRKQKLREVSANCRAARKAITVRAQRARERLRQSIKRTREKAKGVCSTARGDAHAHTLAQIDRQLSALELERSEQARDRIWARPARKVLAAGGRGRARERQHESDDEVAGNIDDPGLRVVWEAVKQRIKPGKHRSRTEAFFEWAAEHAGDVYRIQEADAVRALERLELEERKLAKALRGTGRSSRAALLEAVPF